MPDSRGEARQEHAIVIGGSMAGLLAARVLADHFHRVTLLERDPFPDGPSPRKGLPQAHHIHVLLAAGRRSLEQLLPGLIPELLAAGASSHDAIADVKWISPGGLCPRFPSPIPMLGATRDLIDWAIRQQLRVGNLQIRTSTDVTGLRLGDAEPCVGCSGQRPDERGYGILGCGPGRGCRRSRFSYAPMAGSDGVPTSTGNGN